MVEVVRVAVGDAWLLGDARITYLDREMRSRVLRVNGGGWAGGRPKPVPAAHASNRMVTPERSSQRLMSSMNATGAVLLGWIAMKPVRRGSRA